LRTAIARAATASPEASATLGAEVRAALEQFGGAWSVFAEFLSSRYDLFDAAFCQEVARTRIEGVAMDVDAIAEVFRQEFNRSLDSVLADFDARPIWTSGVAQLHEATLRLTGERVWVQIQRPDAAARVTADVAAIETVCKALERRGPLTHVPWPRTLREIRTRATSHLDYRFTAHQMARQWARWRRYAGVHAPKVFRRFCRPRVLIAECLDGVPLSWVLAERQVNPDGLAAWFKANGIRPNRLARRLLDTFLRDVIEHGACLSDVDPSRILVLRNNHFGIAPTPAPPLVQIDSDRIRALRGIVRHLPTRAYSSVYLDLFGLLEPLPPIDPGELKKRVTRELRGWGQRDAVRTLPPDERTLAALFVGIAGSYRHCRLVLDLNVASAIQALRGLEASVNGLHPRLRRQRLLGRFFLQSARRVARAAARTQERNAPTGPPPIDLDAPFDAIERTERYAESVSARSLQFANTASKPAYLFERAFAALRFVTGLAMAATLLLFVDQMIVRLDALRGVRAGIFLTLAPTLTWLEFLMLAVVNAWLFSLFHRLTLRFRARDSALPRHGVV